MSCSSSLQTGLGGLLLVLLLSGCGDGSASQSYEQRIMQARVQRDMQMREKESVLPPNRRADFRGLDYYGVDSTYRFVTPLQRLEQPDTMMLAENTGRIRAQVRIGRVTIPLPSGNKTLTVFRGASDDPRGRFWIPFADETNGNGTYEAGRYVDLAQAPNDSVVVDFNRAYNPTCAYNPEFACPLPPDGNRIDAPIPVGEKTPKFGQSASS
ncbi:hypothetical protein BSZ35_07735 [Salinibacter sp. 10B]|uniref:DUF1684 domain-containing protein n=1 Tax=Salinibacter sp. 10B TaxID=1923971 RepID=UPI000CF37C22|nr:DUF1684 domain-containing protein [Salinibacter sp. 10B]PQJ34501.1 hypothetical protein BSZ35_07735 [Salinibacter sp. 10B]